MKKSILFLIATVITMSFSMAQGSVKSPAETSENEIMKVEYGAPSKKDREIFGKLVPYGKVWRTGANNSTSVTFKKDVMLAGKSVKAGTYTLFTIPGETEWSVILNTVLGQMGSYEYEKNKGKNLLEVKVPSAKSETSVEKFNITVSASGLTLAWDKVVVLIPVK